MKRDEKEMEREGITSGRKRDGGSACQGGRVTGGCRAGLLPLVFPIRANFTNEARRPVITFAYSICGCHTREAFVGKVLFRFARLNGFEEGTRFLSRFERY